ncbi:MAG: hypothetical protein E7304_04010 [Butyrivibrio sp.]|nr:hypothetical protein [Butyrivibrio sp.]
MRKKAIYEVNSDFRMFAGLREFRRNVAIRISWFVRHVFRGVTLVVTSLFLSANIKLIKAKNGKKKQFPFFKIENGSQKIN